MQKLLTLFLISTFTLAITPPAFAKQAGIVLLPTRIVLEPKDRNVTVMVRNNGDATGAYRVELVDMEMPEKGVLKELPDGAAYSAKPMIRISPRQMVLKPEEGQNVRILIRRPRDLDDGEYRTHLKIKLIDDNVEASNEGPAQHDAVMIQVKPRFSLVIPVIVRQGKTDASVTLDKPTLHHHTLDMVLHREGNRSVIGDMDVEYKTPAGKTIQLQHFAGIAVYRPTSKRQVSIPLEVPKGVSLQGGSLHITYKTQEKEKAKILAEHWLKL